MQPLQHVCVVRKYSDASSSASIVYFVGISTFYGIPEIIKTRDFKKHFFLKKVGNSDLNQPSICAGCIHWRTYTNADSVSLGGAGEEQPESAIARSRLLQSIQSCFIFFNVK
jgi:hypothetical protein